MTKGARYGTLEFRRESAPHGADLPNTRQRAMPDFAIRNARSEDVEALVRLEAASFRADRVSRESFRRLIGQASAALRVVATNGSIAGYALVLFRAHAGVARLYSIAVAEAARGKGMAEALVRDGEKIARRRGCDRLRLEVREDNLPALRLYQRLGYRPFGRHRAYYADGTDALRLERRLAERPADDDRSPRDSRFCFPYIESLVRPVPAAHAASPAGANADGVRPPHQ